MVTVIKNWTARLKTRLRPEDKQLIETAAAMEGLSLSDFVRVAVKHHAEDVLARR
ncbi:DUF1778 domain-containing protein [Sulfobacillus thermosulfidooxidans]|uniref:type II toxin-antitoxin system TacA family antitoxin n=1 Tax=Sulfobacillus thermosulfidooxidans TaxID=28034 RepID=UPI0003F81BC1|nr:DUF1778 domain-containing protein [Sulfobacillus thermosulfidooxidans]